MLIILIFHILMDLNYVLLKMTKEEEVIKVDGSIPVACQSKCYQCMPIQVLIEEEDGDENEQYYPQVWRCRCGDKVFSP